MAKNLRCRWLSPPRSGTRLLIAPWEYRHLRAFATARIAGGGVAGAAGIVCASYAAYGWAAFFVVVSALNLLGGCWYLTVARARSRKES